MAEATVRTMTVDEFLAWAEAQPGRHELLNGHAHAMSPERVGHTRTKYAVSAALTAAIASAGLQCEMLMDGATVRADGKTAFEPDALVRCGKPLPSDAIETPDPVIVVEVASPNPRHIDVGLKFTGYFAVPSIQHYLTGAWSCTTGATATRFGRGSSAMAASAWTHPASTSRSRN